MNNRVASGEENIEITNFTMETRRLIRNLINILIDNEVEAEAQR